MRVLVVGATGALGRHVVPRLLERGHDVKVLVRSNEKAVALGRLRVGIAMGDILDRVSLSRAAAGSDAVLHLATAIPRSGERQDWSLNDRIRREGTGNLLGAVEGAGLRRYVQQSVALLYGEQGQRIVDEDAVLQPSPITESAADMERLVMATPLDWCILRGGLFYGPGTGREEEWRREASEGRLRLPGDGRGLLSLVHVADMARAVVAALEAAPSRSTYNVVDDEPVRYRELYGYITARVGGPEPTEGGEVFLPSLGCSNERLHRSLGWEPAYPTFRSGLA